MENVQLNYPQKVRINLKTHQNIINSNATGFTEITDHKTHLRNAQANSHEPTKLHPSLYHSKYPP
jgi:hypothetical protein